MGKGGWRSFGAVAKLVRRLRDALPAGPQRAKRNTSPTVRTGRRAERGAERLLRRRGCRVLARNYQRRSGEIDLVVLDGEQLAFVEVRHRGAGAWVSPLASVDASKQRRLARTAALFLADHPEHRFREARFDIVCVSKRNLRLACEWIPNAFEPTDG